MMSKRKETNFNSIYDKYMVKLLYLFDILLAIVNYLSKSGRMLISETKANLLSHNCVSNRNSIK